MKKLLLLLFPVIFSACDIAEPVFWNYAIINNSGRIIEIIPILGDERDINKKITLANGRKLQKKEMSHPHFGTGLTMQYLIANYDYRLTGVEVIFDNEKKIIYEVCEMRICDNPRNIFGHSNNDDFIETYIFTVTDYENATDCGGNCN